MSEEPGMGVGACNPGTGEAEAGRRHIPGLPELHDEILCQKQSKNLRARPKTMKL